RSDRRHRQPGGHRDRQRDVVRDRAEDRAGLPEEPAAAGDPGPGRHGGGLPVRAGQAARDAGPGHPDAGRRRLVRHHPAGRRAGRHRHRRRRGPRRAGRGDHGTAARGPAGVRAGREVARGHHAQARRLVPRAGPGQREWDGGRRSAHGELPLHDLRRLVQGTDLCERRPRRPFADQRGAVRQLEFLYKGVLLGVRGKGIRGLPTYREQTIGIPPGAILVFYTDGLTDRRTRADGSGHYTEDEAVQMLQHAVRAAAASGDADAVATAAEYAVPGDIDDDMAILVVQSSPSELASAERMFPAEPIMVSEARRLAAQTFRSWGMDPGQIELACLLVSEVVTNAVLHSSITPSPSRDLDLDIEPMMMPAPVGAPAGPAGQVLAGAVPPGRAAVRPAAVPPQQTTGPEGWAGAPPGAPAAPREFRLRLRRG